MHHLDFVVVDGDKITWNVSMAVYGDDFFVDVVRSVFEQLNYTPILHFSFLRSTIYEYSHTVGSYVGLLPVIEYPKSDANVPIAVKFDDRKTFVIRLSQI